jgi:hypothetical protein
MYDLFAHAPGWFVLVLFAVVPAVVAVVIHTWFRRRVPPEKLLPHQEVAGFLVAVVGVLYAVVLGFLVISVWLSFDAAQRNADAETNDLSDILHLALALPEPTKSQIRNLVAWYAFEVRDREWPMLAYEEEDQKARSIMFSGLHTVAMMRPQSGAPSSEAARQASIRDAALAAFRDLTSRRRQRLLDAQSHVSTTLYFALITGALILLSFVLLFGVDSAALQLTMTALVAGMIGLQIGVIFELDRPFWGAVHIRSDAWDLLIRDNHLAPPGGNAAASP